jgi:hypothetical protein
MRPRSAVHHVTPSQRAAAAFGKRNVHPPLVADGGAVYDPTGCPSRISHPLGLRDPQIALCRRSLRTGSTVQTDNCCFAALAVRAKALRHHTGGQSHWRGVDHDSGG